VVAQLSCDDHMILEGCSISEAGGPVPTGVMAMGWSATGIGPRDPVGCDWNDPCSQWGSK